MHLLKRYTLIGIAFVIIAGTVFHFVYDWSGNNPIVALFFPINESIWEHMKLGFFPMLFYSFYMHKKLRKSYPCITSGILSGILVNTFSIPIIFYTYTGILGTDIFVLDIATFVLSVLITFYLVYRLTLSCRMQKHTAALLLLVCIVGVCFIVFTYAPPNIQHLITLFL